MKKILKIIIGILYATLLLCVLIVDRLIAALMPWVNVDSVTEGLKSPYIQGLAWVRVLTTGVLILCYFFWWLLPLLTTAVILWIATLYLIGRIKGNN